MIKLNELAEIETEKDILCIMMIRADESIPLVRAELVADDFYRESHKLIFSTLLDMYQAQEPIDFTTIVPKMKSNGTLDRVGGLTAIGDIYSKVCTRVGLESYIEIIKDRSRRRHSIQLMEGAIAKAADLSEDMDIQSFQTELARVAAERYVKERNMGDIALDFMQQINDRYNRDEADFCVMTGLPNLDSLIHGLRKQELIYLAARPSMGKSALAIQIAINAALTQGKSVMYVSLEMGERQIFGRAVANLAQVDSEVILYDSDLVTRKKEYEDVSKAAEDLRNAKLHLRFQDVNTPSGIFNQAQQIQGKYGLDIIIIDHVHLMRTGLKNENDNLNATMKYISGELKKIAMNFDIPVLALAQLSRGVENRNDKRPMMADLRDSGSLEQDADKVLMMYRESYYTHVENEPDLVEVIVRKQRDGRLGVAYFNFFKSYAMLVPAQKPENLEGPV